MLVTESNHRASAETVGAPLVQESGYGPRVTGKGDTLSLGESSPAGEDRRGPHLFLELECDRPLPGPARWRLTGLEHLRIGRGSVRRSERAGRSLTIQVPDGRMSLEHLELRRQDGGWMARDLGSKNGLLVDGVRLPEAELEDGSLLQLGHTLFAFRAEMPLAEPAALDFGELPGGVQPLSTMSAAFATVLERAAAIAPSRVPVLLSGESGTGKEVLARHIHALSGRKGALVAVNSGAIPPNLVEAELFGHKKGAFSGATRDRPGLVRASDGGTLFLDEIGDLPLPAQAALLRVLQEAEVLPVGSHRPESLDLRAIAATHHDLKRSVREGHFRHDLLARLEGITLALPALRDRPEDIPLLMVLLLRKLAPERPDVKLTPAAAQALLSHPWPLNVRELEQALAGALALSGIGPIDVRHLPATVVEGADLPPEELARELTPDDIRRRDELLGLLREHRGNLSAVSRAMGKGRTQIGRWIARYRIDVRSLKS